MHCPLCGICGSLARTACLRWQCRTYNARAPTQVAKSGTTAVEPAITQLTAARSEQMAQLTAFDDRLARLEVDVTNMTTSATAAVREVPVDDRSPPPLCSGSGETRGSRLIKSNSNISCPSPHRAAHVAVSTAQTHGGNGTGGAGRPLTGG
eukprot:3893744-Pyramimonas_sp.AAC.1